MAKENLQGVASGSTGGNAETAAQSGKGGNRRKRNQPVINERQAFVRQTARNAIRGAKLVIKRVENGDEVSADAIEACAILAGKTATLLLGG